MKRTFGEFYSFNISCGLNTFLDVNHVGVVLGFCTFYLCLGLLILLLLIGIIKHL